MQALTFDFFQLNLAICSYIKYYTSLYFLTNICAEFFLVYMESHWVMNYKIIKTEYLLITNEIFN